MVEEFMDAIRATPEIFRGRDEDIDTFCGLLDRKEAWCLAINVVPEFRLTQYVEQCCLFITRRETDQYSMKGSRDTARYISPCYSANLEAQTTSCALQRP
jgi:hypothetical protein